MSLSSTPLPAATSTGPTSPILTSSACGTRRAHGGGGRQFTGLDRLAIGGIGHLLLIGIAHACLPTAPFEPSVIGWSTERATSAGNDMGPTMTLKFLVMSDLHLVPEGELSLTLDTAARLDQAVEAVNAR